MIDWNQKLSVLALWPAIVLSIINVNFVVE